MHIVVVGCGRVGATLADQLEQQGISVAVVDRKAEAFRRLPEEFGGRRHVGVGFDRDVLRSAGIEGATGVAAVTNGDNSNILIARVAREYFGVERVVARIYDQRRAAVYERLGIPTIATVSWTASRVLRRVLPDAEAVEWTDPSASVSLIERPAPERWVGRRVADVQLPGAVRVAAVSRLGQGRIPTDDLLVQEGDLLWFVVDAERLGELDAHLEGTEVSR
ncbi:MAG: TrkA family potassium uptake protein [Acidimicrobiales bacterium]|nr:TrkA family potassium uptake protein [Acidimicrobiales bacterium]